MYHDAESAQELEPGYENSLLTGPGRRILSPTGSRWEHHGEKVVFGTCLTDGSLKVFKPF
jgi:hypothetical protein